MKDGARNCKEYCRFAKCCYLKGEPGLDPDECPRAWKIEDILMETKDWPDQEDEEEEDDNERDPLEETD